MKWAVLFFPLFVTAADEKILSLTDGRKIYTLSSITNSSPKAPTLILLPGIYRGFHQNEDFLNRLTEKKINWVAVHFSRHPRPVLEGSLIWNQSVTSQDLAQEVLATKKFFKLKKTVVVSLSFSASVIPALNPHEFPIVIETAPMGRSNETMPTNEHYENWQKWVSSFPIWGSWVVQSTEYWAYRSFWMQKVTDLTGTYPEYKNSEPKIAEGLAQLAWSSRNFDLRNQNFASGPERFWILGEKENAKRLKIQMAAIKEYERQSRGSKVYIIQGAGHIVPVEQPGRYVYILENIVKSIAR